MKGYKELVELLNATQARRTLDCSTKAVCEYQDMIAHSDEDQLEELSRGPLMESFYWVYGAAYGTYESIRFYHRHSQKYEAMQCKIADYEAEIEELEAENKALQEAAKKTEGRLNEAAAIAQKNRDELVATQKRAQGLERIIIELKAKLYDLMTA